MKIRDWWNRLLSKFRKKSEADSTPAVELVAEEAPEPVPERKTSDEMIIQMADSNIAKEVDTDGISEKSNESNDSEESIGSEESEDSKE